MLPIKLRYQDIKLSFIGFKTKVVNIKIPVDELMITLYEGNELLQEVEVTSRKNKFSRKDLIRKNIVKIQ